MNIEHRPAESAAFFHSSVALVTGGAVRLGRAVVRRLAERGCGVIIQYRSSETQARELAAALAQTGARIYIVSGSLSTPAGCREMFANAWELSGGFNILVNNAAVFEKKDLLSTTIEEFSETLQVVFFSAALLSRLLATRMGGARPIRCLAAEQVESARPLRSLGRIVNMLDARISNIAAGCAAYNVAKAMLEAYTLQAALDMAPSLTVNAVAPGPVIPPRAAVAREPAGRIPIGFRPTPDDVASAVLFLLENDSITGQVVYVDGGQHLVGLQEAGS